MSLVGRENANEALMAAIERHDKRAVQQCLERGCDPNYTRSPEDDEGYGVRPKTPLALVMFCISDSLLEDHDLEQFAEVARLLLRHGADPGPAMQIAEERYGKYDPSLPSSPFMDVWHIVAKGRPATG
jgi:hypothetical protein